MAEADDVDNPGNVVDFVSRKIGPFEHDLAHWETKLLGRRFVHGVTVVLAKPLNKCKQALFPRYGSIESFAMYMTCSSI